MANTIRGLLPDGTAPTPLYEQVVNLIHEEAPEPDLTPYPTRSEMDAALDEIESLPDGDMPIFANIAAAQAWEAMNPGRAALWVGDPIPEPNPNDTTPPVAGSMTVTPLDVSARLTVTGASDDYALHPSPYSFSTDGGATWSPWVMTPTYKAEGLTPETPYAARHRVRDLAGHVSIGAVSGFVTEARLANPRSPDQVGAVLHDFDLAEGTTQSGRIVSVADSAGTRAAMIAADQGPTLEMLGGNRWGRFTSSESTRLRSTGDVDDILESPSPATGCVIFRPDSLASNQYVFDLGGARLDVTNSGAVRVAVGANVSNSLDNVLTSGVPVFASWSMTGPNITIRVGPETFTGTDSTAFHRIGRNVALGSNAPGAGQGHFNGAIARAWIHGKAITQAEHDSMLSWARAEYGVA